MAFPYDANQYFVKPDGTLRKHAIHRKSGRGRWPRPDAPDELVATVYRGKNRALKIEPGPAYGSDDRWQAEIIRLEHGVQLSSSTTDLGIRIPNTVRQMLGDRIREAIARTVRRFGQFSSETGMLDVLMNDIEEKSLSVDGWLVKLRGQGFSAKKKEPMVGADGAWVIEIRSGEENTTKALWVQAKQTEHLPQDVFTLPDLREQFRLMRGYTDSSFVLVLTPAGIVISDGQQYRPLDEVLVAAVGCDYGSQNSTVISMSLDLHHVGVIEVEEISPMPSASWSNPRERERERSLMKVNQYE